MHSSKNMQPMRIIAIIFALLFLGIAATFAVSREKPSGSVTGRVVSFKTNKPIAGAKVHHPSRDTYVKTDKDGNYTLYGVPAGKNAISVFAIGYTGSYNDKVKVKEGETTKDVNFILERRSSYFNVYTYQKVFTPKETPKISLSGYLVKKIQVRVYKVPQAQYSSVIYRLNETNSANPKGFEVVYDHIFNSTLNEDGDFEHNLILPIDKNGLYIVETEAVGGRQKHTTWLTKSDLGIIIKKGPGEILVYAQNFTTGKPVKGASVGLLYEGKPVVKGTTDKDGIFHYTKASNNSYEVIATASDSVASSRTYNSNNPGKNKVYAYTERPVYRPGQTVSYKGFIRVRRGENFDSQSEIPVKVKVTDSKGASVVNTTLYTNGFGSFSGSFKLKKEPALGSYSLQIIPSGSENDTLYSNFQVLEYKKPEYKIEVLTEKPHYVAGDKIQVRVKGTYYFGAPVKGAKFNLTVFESAYRWNKASWIDFIPEIGNPENAEDYGGVMYETTGTLDEKGEAVVTFQTKKFDSNLNLSIEAEATDSSNRTVTGTTDVPLSVGEFALYAYPSKYIYKPGAGVLVRIEALDYKENPVKDQPVTVTINKVSFEEDKKEAGRTENNQPYYEYQLKRVEKQISPTKRKNTNSEGVAHISFTADEQGTYEVVVTSRDNRANEIKYVTQLYVANGEDGPALGESDIKIITDKKKYDPGQTVTAAITCSRPNTYVLVTIEGRKVYKKQVIFIKNGSYELKIPIKKEYFPNFFISACCIKDTELASSSENIEINRNEKKLNIEIKPEKEKYEPGEKAKYKITVKDNQSKPVKAELSIGVVDEAIYAIAPDLTPDIHQAFWNYEYNYVDTTYSFARDYSGGADKDRPSKIRKKFLDTAFWMPSIITDENGNASVEFTMPDNLTTWITTVRGATADTRVGQAVNSVLCTKDLLVRLETPRFLIQKDRVFISGIVHNYTDKPQSAKVWLETNGVKITSTQSFTDLIKPADEKVYYWEVIAKDPGKARVTILCKGSTAEDAMELEFPVYPYGVEDVTAQSGYLANDTDGEKIELNLPENVIKNASEMRITLSPSLAGTMLENLDYLINYPYGCVEQTMSSFLPAVAAKKAFNNLGIKDADVEEKLPKITTDGLARLYTLQHYDGGWGWWQDDETHPYMTAYVVMGLHEASKNGIKIKESVLKNGIKALEKMVARKTAPIKTMGGTSQQGEEWNTRAYLLYALYKVGKPNADKTIEAYNNRDKMNDYALSLLAMTLDGINKKEELASVIDILDKRANRKYNECWWEGRTFDYSWVDNTVESTAYCLQAYSQIKSDDKKIPEIIRWLVNQKQGKGYFSTKDTAAVVLAFTNYLIKSKEMNPDYRLKVAVNDNNIYNSKISSAILPDNLRNKRLGAGSLQTGKNTVSFSKEGKGNLYYTAMLKYYITGATIDAASNGIKINRTYHKINIRKKPKGEIEEVLIDLNRDEIKIGDKIRVTLTLEADRGYRFLLIEDPLPAGFEVDIQESEKNTGSMYWAQREIRDEKVSFFVLSLARGTKLKMAYDLRAEMSGEVNALPAHACCMYQPEIRGRSASDVLKILKTE